MWPTSDLIFWLGGDLEVPLKLQSLTQAYMLAEGLENQQA